MPIYTGRKVNGLSDGKWLPSPEGVYNDGDITDVFGAVSVWGLGPSQPKHSEADLQGLCFATIVIHWTIIYIYAPEVTLPSLVAMSRRAVAFQLYFLAQCLSCESKAILFETKWGSNEKQLYEIRVE